MTRSNDELTEENWMRLKLDYETYLVVPSKYRQQLFEILSNAKLVTEKTYGEPKGPRLLESVPGFDFVTHAYVAGAAARAKMVDESDK